MKPSKIIITKQIKQCEQALERMRKKGRATKKIKAMEMFIAYLRKQ